MKIGIDIRVIGKKRTGDEVYFFNLVKNLAVADKKNEYYLYIDRDPEKDEDLKREIEKLELGDNFKIIFINSPIAFGGIFGPCRPISKKIRLIFFTPNTSRRFGCQKK